MSKENRFQYHAHHLLTFSSDLVDVLEYLDAFLIDSDTHLLFNICAMAVMPLHCSGCLITLRWQWLAVMLRSLRLTQTEYIEKPVQ